MSRLTKNKKIILEKYDSQKLYSLEEASKIIKDISFTKFDASIDLDVRLGVDPKKPDQMIRGAISLPHGTGKILKVLALCTPDKEEEAKKAGADYIGLDDFIKKIENGWTDIDVIVTIPTLMPKLGRLGKVLGPRGLMPNPKSGTVTNDIGIEKHDSEGRVITLEYPDFYLVTVYTPNSKRDLLRLEYREKEWDIDFLNYIIELEKTKPVIFCGDLNVAHKEIDLKNPKSNKRNAGFTIEERQGFDNIVNHGFIDTFRHFNNEGDNYTWWSYMAQSRDRNVGWRIDYFCISDILSSNLKVASIHPQIMGSDHCPVSIEIDI